VVCYCYIPNTSQRAITNLTRWEFHYVAFCVETLFHPAELALHHTSRAHYVHQTPRIRFWCTTWLLKCPRFFTHIVWHTCYMSQYLLWGRCRGIQIY
jgi:hypothetical protein